MSLLSVIGLSTIGLFLLVVTYALLFSEECCPFCGRPESKCDCWPYD